MNTLYIYKNYIATDEETMNDKIFNLLGENTDDVRAIENQDEWEWENVEEEQASVVKIIDYMKNGYIFLDGSAQNDRRVQE